MDTVWAIKAHAKLRISYFRFRNETLKARRAEITAINSQADKLVEILYPSMHPEIIWNCGYVPKTENVGYFKNWAILIWCP